MPRGDLRSFDRSQQRRGLRPRTIQERHRVLERLALRGPLLRLSAEDIEEWLDAQHVTPRSRAAYLSNIHAYYRWAVRDGLRADDPTVHIDRARLPRKLPRPIGDDDLDMALRMAGPRMKAWLLLACYSGLRCMEIAGLRREDILDGRPEPLVRVADGKGGKEDLLPLHPDTLAALRVYGLPERGPVFVSARGRQFAPATVSGYVADHLHGLGLVDTAHRLRDWFGTEVYRDTKDLRLTQELMRHNDPSSTAGYVAYDRPGAAKAVTGLRAGGETYRVR